MANKDEKHEVALVPGVVEQRPQAAVAFAAHGVVGYVRRRKPRSYHDSIMPPMESTNDAKPKT